MSWCSSSIAFYCCQLYQGFKIHNSCVYSWRLSWWTKYVGIIIIIIIISQWKNPVGFLLMQTGLKWTLHIADGGKCMIDRIYIYVLWEHERRAVQLTVSAASSRRLDIHAKVNSLFTRDVGNSTSKTTEASQNLSFLPVLEQISSHKIMSKNDILVNIISWERKQMIRACVRS